MAIRLIKETKYLEEGEYTGTITQIKEYSDKGYLSIEISVDNANVTFKNFMAYSNPYINQFAEDYTDENGMFDNEKAIGSKVCFTVKDSKKNSETNELKSVLSGLKKIG